MKPRHEYNEALAAKGDAPVPFAGPSVLFRRLWRKKKNDSATRASAVVRLLIFGGSGLVLDRAMPILRKARASVDGDRNAGRRTCRRAAIRDPELCRFERERHAVPGRRQTLTAIDTVREG